MSDLNRLFFISSICSLVIALSSCRATEISSVEIEIPASDVTLHARVAGDLDGGDVLVAIHGGPGNSSDYMISLEELAGDDFAVVTYDQRGVGRSTEPSSGYSLMNYVEDLEAVRKATGAGKVHLFGHSWGGVVAMRYATVYPQNVRSIILMGSGPPSMQAALSGQAHKARQVSMLQKEGIIPENISSLEDILPTYFSDPYFAMPDELKDMYYSPKVEQSTWSALGDFDFTDEVRNINHSVLLLWGEDDPFGLSMAESIQSALSSADVEFIVLESCGHYWHECPNEFFLQVRLHTEGLDG